MANGYMEKMLEIDLTTGNIKTTDTHMKYAKTFIGGRGLGGRLLWDMLKDKDPGLDPTSPDNPLMFLTGPMTGTPLPAPSRITVYTKSGNTKPLNSPYEHASTVAWSCAGGMFAPELKFAGYDGVIITGKANSPVYIVIDNDQVEIRDAKHLWGQGTNKTDKMLREELGPDFKHMYIGPAGENGVYYAGIITESSRAAGRSGVGRVMGSKNLKAIAVRGDQIVPVDHKKVQEARVFLMDLIKNWSAYEQWRRWGTAAMLTQSGQVGTQITKNYQEGTYEHTRKINAVAADNSFWVRHRACYQCPIRCMKIGCIPEGPYQGTIAEGPEYETGTLHGSNLYAQDLYGMMASIEKADDLGFDSISVGNVIAWAMECYEKGILTKADLGGLDLTWGNMDAAIKLQEMICRGEGIGKTLAKGVMRAAEEVGKGSEELAMHVKGSELAAWGIRANHGFGVVYGTSTRGACHQVGPSVLVQHERSLCDTIVACRFVYYGLGSDPLREAFNAVTNFNFSKEEFLQVGERLWNQEKVFNAREGFRREDDYVPKRFQTPLTYGPKAGAVLTAEDQEKILDDYYTERGWDLKTSFPKEGKLKELGLDDLVPVINSL